MQGRHTRFDGKGGGARYDIGIEVGKDLNRWRSEGETTARAGEVGRKKDRVISDHVWARWSTPYKAVVKKGEEREAPALRGDGKAARQVKAAYKAALRTAECKEAMAGQVLASAAEGRSAVQAGSRWLVQQGRMASAQVLAETARACSETMHCAYNRWAWALKQIVAGRARGEDVRELSGGLMHPKLGLHTILRRRGVEFMSRLQVWRELEDFVRRQLRRTGGRAARVMKAKDAELITTASKIVADGFANAVVNLQRAWRAVKAKRQSIALSAVHVADDPSGRKVEADEQDFLQVLRDVGVTMVERFADTPPSLEAFRAWHHVFLEQYEELKGSDGETWEWEKELTWDIFKEVLRCIPRGKAVGAGAFNIELLLHAGDRIQRIFYEALMMDLRNGVMSEDWHRVLYVLLVKPPPDDPNLVSGRREIALMAQDMKLLMHMLRITAYRRVTGRLLAAQCGWLPGYGATDPGLTMQMVLQQARRLKCDIYLLYIDLSTMFPRLDRQAMDMAEALIGLPAEVRDLVHRIYGAGREDQEAAVRCQFDSAAGLSEPFRNYMGALMGDVLSPDRAKILLNTILQAIAACARGFKLWGHEKQTRWIEQLSYADDWVGIFNSSEALQAAWAVWTAWIAVSGCKLGFKSASDGTPLKTAVTGMRHVAGVAREIENPKLSTPAGQVVQTLGMDEAYKYLGMWRCASGAEAKGRKALQSKMMAAVARMGKMYRPSRADFVMVANGLLGGLATYYLATEYVSFQELDVKVEARWRRHYARMFKREVSRPNVQLYESVQTARGARRQAPARRHRIHVSTFGQAALYSTICKAMADVHDTQQRAAVRSGLALAAVRWGCREDPSTWDCRHIKGALEAALRTGAGYVADAWWLAVIVLREQVEGAEDKPWEEVWRWMHGSAGPLDASSEHFGPPRSQMVFEPTSSGGLGAPVAGGLIGAGLVAVGHFCVCRWKGATEAGRWAEDFVEARRRHPLLQSTHKQEYEETVAWLAEAAEPAAPEGTRFTYVSERSVFGVQAAVSQTVAKVCLTEAAALVAALQADSVEPLVVAAEWEGMIRAAFQGVEKAPAVPWQMGAPTWEEMALGPRLLVDFGSKLQCTGGGGHWREREAAAADPEILGSTARAAIGPDGYVVGWQREAARLVAQVQFDAHGWPLWTGSRQRVTMVEAESMEPGPRLLVRSRLSLGEVTVIDKPVCKRPKLGTFVNVRALRAMWRKLCTWQARVQATSAWTLDGTRKVVSDADGKEKLVVARAAVSSSGEVTGGILEEEELVDNYLAELAAQIDVFEHMAEGERPLVIFDATSPVLAMLTFRRLQGRARQGRLVATWLATLEKLMRKCEAVVWIWQSSHVGEPCNEAADCAADAAAAAEGDAPLPRLRCEFASVTFPMHRGAAFSWALPLAARATAARLRGTAARSLRHTEGIHFPVPLLGEAAEDARLAIASDRCQVADDGHYYGKAFQREVSAMVCPHGCTEADGAGSRPDWMHAAFRCTGRAVAGARKRWRLCLDKVVTRLSQLQSKNGGGPQIQLAYLKRALGESSERGVAMAAFPPHLRRGSLGATTMREAICMHLEMIHKPGVDSDAAFLRLLAAMGEAGLQVQLAYGTATTVMVDAAHRRATDLALCGKLLRGWQAHVVRHSSPASCTKWRELRRAWQLTRAAAQRMVEDATTVTARLQAARRSLCSEVEVAVPDHLSSDARSVSRRHRLWGTACWWARWAKYVRVCRAARGAVRGGGQRESRMLSILLTAARGDRGQLRGRVPPLSERSWRAWTRGALRRWHRGGGFATVEADKGEGSVGISEAAARGRKGGGGSIGGGAGHFCGAWRGGAAARLSDLVEALVRIV